MGFFPGRGTSNVVSLSNDVISYYNRRGSPAVTCTLDSGQAFDAVRHDISFNKATGVIPDHCWLMSLNLYTNITVQSK